MTEPNERKNINDYDKIIRLTTIATKKTVVSDFFHQQYVDKGGIVEIEILMKLFYLKWKVIYRNAIYDYFIIFVESSPSLFSEIKQKNIFSDC